VLAAERLRRGAPAAPEERGAAAMAEALRPERRSDIAPLVERLGRELKAMAG
jgi:hypothetical protein